MKYLVLPLLFLISAIQAQDPRLAQEYFNNGEFEKAASLYQEMLKKNPANPGFFEKYFECILALKKYDDAEEILNKEIRKRPKEALLHVFYGNLWTYKNEVKKAEQQYLLAVEKTPSDVMGVHKLGNALIQLTRYDLAIQVYEKGEKNIKPQTRFTYNLADLYRRKGDYSKMILYYLNGVEEKTVQLINVQSIIVAYFSEEEYRELQAQLYERIEAKPEIPEFSELLMWSYVQLKDYQGAMQQAKALDRQFNENGNRVFQLAMTAYLDNDYHTAISGFSYVRDKGPSNSFYHESYRQLLVSRRNLIVEKKDYSNTDLIQLESDYQKYLADFGRNYLSAPLIIEFAELEARYLGKVREAIMLLEDLIKLSYVDNHIKSKAKLNLADYYLIIGERWEATLLYSQVDKDFTEDELGEMARFKNARLSYFAGDFQWAQEQFDILKNATSRLISNDAIDLSVFILDNLNQDSTGEILLKYASAELKLFQNQYDSALWILDNISFTDPEVVFLEDDVWYLQAKIYQQQQRLDEAIEKYQKILDKHPEEIRADNALWEMAKIYDQHLNNTAKAMELYEKLFIDFSNSVQAVEARKRYRQLRGDKLQ
ncbi:MAG: tetratricopeptide repeat protein [Saprospiraceae bacterium]|nr:tetratricopeptide repeat protein [Saprospiraceae bacterium]